MESRKVNVLRKLREHRFHETNVVDFKTAPQRVYLQQSINNTNSQPFTTAIVS